MRTFIILLCVFSVTGCVSPPARPALHVIGSSDDQQRLAGVWKGRVEDREFELRFDDATLAGLSETPARILWVRVSGANVSGALAPQFDANCSCDVYTTFDAVLEGSVLRGTLQRRVRLEWHDAGTWLAERAASQE